MPSWDLFEAQPCAYRDEVLPPTVPARLAVELGAVQGWHRYVDDSGDVLGVEGFGASALAGVLLREFGFTVDSGGDARAPGAGSEQAATRQRPSRGRWHERNQAVEPTMTGTFRGV